MRQQLGPRLDDGGELAFQRLRDPMVILLSGALEQQRICGILDERVLELVLRRRRLAEPIEDTGGDEGIEFATQRRLVGLGHRTYHLVAEFSAEHGSERRE